MAKKEGKIKTEIFESLPVLADKLVSATKKIVRMAKSEEDLRIGFEKALDPIFKSLGIKSQPKYEHTTSVRGRSDAIHGQVIIEYEKPKSFKSKAKISHAYDQLKRYIGKEKGQKVVGVGFDGRQIFFVRGQDNKLVQLGPYPVNQESMRTLLTHLRALSRLALTAENLAETFGPKSKIAEEAVSAFVDALIEWGTTRTDTFFDEWKRIFGIVYGEQFKSHQKEEAESLTKIYGVKKDVDFQVLLFSVHTYFALLMKLIAAELLSLRETEFGASYTASLAHASDEELKAQLTDLEDGGIYAKRGITNFLEGDFFRWYLDSWEEGAPALKDAVREITRALGEFEPATTIIDPEVTKDLLKKLYQYLVPREIRQKLGEYYTPDWLAELVLNEVGYDGDNFKRVLDPACGSGTFLVLAIQRAKEWGARKERPRLEIAKSIKDNIWGFDLNPLAVIASRTNYLFALGDLVSELDEWEMPVYLADSVLMPEKVGQLTLGPTGDTRDTHTSVGVFHVPAIWVKDEGFLMKKAAPLVEEMARQGFSTEEAMKRFKKEALAFPPHENVVLNFYKEILDLEKRRKNGIWARFLKNAFAPSVAGEFDFVIGNPPWIRWDYLSQEYRKATLSLWKSYGLFSLEGYETRLGGGKKDFSMLFTYAATDYYLRDGGKLGFLITQEVLKSKGAGEGFRRFRIGKEGKSLKVLGAHDFVAVKPFEGAANKTAVIILRKGSETRYPLPYWVWNRKRGVGKISTAVTLNEALPLLQKRKLFAQPIGSKFGAWETATPEQTALSRFIEGENAYKAILGANPNPYGVFWLKIQQVLSSGKIIVRNLVEKGKLDVTQVQKTIEGDLVYPAIRGSDIKRWGYNQEVFLLMVQDPKTRKPYPQTLMKQYWPRTYSYLVRFKDILLNRGSKTIRRLAESTEFYAMFGVEQKTVSPHKVVWKAMSNDIYATVISSIKTPLGYKVGIPLHTTSLFAAANEDEAYYLCAIINSIPVREFIKSYSAAGRGFGTPSVMEHVGIPKFDPKNKPHQKLAEISKKCHQLKAEGKEREIEKLEKENDNLVKQLFGIKK